MAYVVSVSCDNSECNKVFTLHTFSDPGAIPALGLPRDWRYVDINFGNVGGTGKGIVCSINCSLVWMKRQILTTEQNIRIHEGYPSGMR